MGLSDIKDRLPHIPGIDDLTMRTGPNGTERYRIGDREVEIPAGNAARRNRVQYIADGFAPVSQSYGFMSMDEPANTVPALTDTNTAAAWSNNATGLPAVDIVPTAIPAKPSEPTSILAGFQPGLIKARIDAIKQKAAERRTASLAKLDASAAKLESVDAAIELYAEKIEQQADAELQEFATHTNGGPA